MLTALLAGIPAGSPVTERYINARLRARQGGAGASPRQRTEKDEVEFTAGVRDGHATGNPIALHIRNRDQTYKHLPPVHAPRPGHADLAGALNRGLTDARDIVERASARETAARVAAGAIAAECLEALGIHVLGHVVAVGGLDVYCEPGSDLEDARTRREASELHALGAMTAQDEALALVAQAKKAGDTLGGVIEVVAVGAPVGLGGHESPETKLSTGLAAALMGVQAVKGVEIGLGFGSAALRGSALQDVILPSPTGGVPARGGNNAGGIEGGMSNGQPIVLRAAMKPLATLREALPSVDLTTGEAAPARVERSDVTAVPRLAIVAEAVVALELLRHVRRRFGGAHLEEVKAAMAAQRQRMDDTLAP